MFRFENPEYLWLLVAVAVLALIRFVTYFNQKKRLRKFGDPKLMKQLRLLKMIKEERLNPPLFLLWLKLVH